MSLAPLLDAPPAIPLHAFAAMAAFALGIVQFAAPKGTLPHRTVGWIWVGLMVTVAASSFWIHQIRLVGPWSPIRPAVDLHTDRGAAGGMAGTASRHQRPSPHHDLHFRRGAGGRGPLHRPARTDHAQRDLRTLGGRQRERIWCLVSGSGDAPPGGPRGQRHPAVKSMKKRREKQRAAPAIGVVKGAAIRYMILQQN